ncbi:MAG: Trk system potassium transporter TrkA [Clostridiales bacterium]|nr:Trk system potassium transporter TrkA [Clostridiales bacterium]
MKVIIVGCGRVGRTLAEKLNGDGNAVTVVDMLPSKVNEITGQIDVMGVVGSGATHTTLIEAGIKNADLFIAVTNSDELNLLCCMVAKKEGNCQTIARLKNPQYSDEAEYLRRELGLAMVINPEYAAAQEIARVLQFPSAIKIEPFAKGHVELIKFRLPKDSALIGSSVKDIIMKYRANVLVCTVERGEEAYIANGDFVFAEKDVVSIVASAKNAHDFFAKIKRKGHSIKNVLVAGGGTITHYLCEILQKSGISLKIVEKDEKICEDLAADFPKLNIIHGKPSDKELLLEEGVKQAGAFVALSNLDEENILLSLFARDVNDGKIITKINRTDYDSVIRRLDLDTVITPKNVTADSILRYVRSTKNAKGSNIETLYNIIEDKVEATEFIVKENAPLINIPLSQLKFKENVLVASIVRDGDVIIPRGNDVILSGDSVIVVTKTVGLSDISDVLR